LADQYEKPYLESSCFIAWIKDEVIENRSFVDEIVKDVKGKEGIQKREVIEKIERGKITAHVLRLAEEGEFAIYTSALTLAEVHKKRKGQILADDLDERILAYFEHDYIKIIDVDRRISEEANEYCRKYGLLGNDAIHLACALRAGCDVLLTWDDDFNAITHSQIRIEQPRIIGQTKMKF
jgi:predicted nucleic acid-binding protein